MNEENKKQDIRYVIRRSGEEIDRSGNYESEKIFLNIQSE
jgi:hypothetical protein